MFAGSIYTLGTLMVWLQEKLAKVSGDIVLADGQIRYLDLISTTHIVKVIWPDADVSVLERGRLLKV